MLTLHSVTFERHYKNLFQDIRGDIHPGDCLQIVGSNGSGKTTLLRILSGLLEPSSGEILWHNQSIFKIREDYQQNIQYIGHKNGLKLHLTVYENIEWYYALHNQSLTNHHWLTAVERTGLVHQLKTITGQLSQGLQRRLSLIKLMLHPQPLWILDEPLTALDAEAQTLWIQVLREHLQNKGSVIMTTHQNIFIDAFQKKILLDMKHA